jgi:rubrerythrin
MHRNGVRVKRELNDLRLLKLAEMYEAAYERFVLEVAGRMIEDEDVRALVMTLASPQDRHHERIVEQVERLNAALGPEDRSGILHAALLDVAEVERAARDFYLRRVDEVHDPGVAGLFRQLAHEEAQHARIAQKALDLAAAHKAGSPAGASVNSFRLLPAPDEEMLLREGVSDFGARGFHSRAHAP